MNDPIPQDGSDGQDPNAHLPAIGSGEPQGQPPVDTPPVDPVAHRESRNAKTCIHDRRIRIRG